MRFDFRRKQSGFVLAVSMIFLIVMTMLAVTSIKKATLDEKVSFNLRAQDLAFQAAERALRFCEKMLILTPGDREMCKKRVGDDNDPKVPGNAEDVMLGFPMEWANMDNWKDIPGPNSAIRLSGLDSVPGVAAQPQCMLERWDVPGERTERDTSNPWVITARGVGSVSTGVVWLQAVIRCGNY
jgi:type IV pilus assembly protein PilX